MGAVHIKYPPVGESNDEARIGEESIGSLSIMCSPSPSVNRLYVKKRPKVKHHESVVGEASIGEAVISGSIIVGRYSTTFKLRTNVGEYSCKCGLQQDQDLDGEQG